MSNDKMEGRSKSLLLNRKEKKLTVTSIIEAWKALGEFRQRYRIPKVVPHSNTNQCTSAHKHKHVVSNIQMLNFPNFVIDF